MSDRRQLHEQTFESLDLPEQSFSIPKRQRRPLEPERLAEESVQQLVLVPEVALLRQVESVLQREARRLVPGEELLLLRRLRPSEARHQRRPCHRLQCESQ